MGGRLDYRVAGHGGDLRFAFGGFEKRQTRWWITAIVLAGSIAGAGCNTSPPGSDQFGFGAPDNSSSGMTSHSPADGGASSSGGASATGTSVGSSSRSASTGGGSSGGAQVSAGSSSSGSTTGSGSSGGAGSSSGSAGANNGTCGDAGPMNNPEIDYSSPPTTLTMTPFSVPPGQEIYQCQTFANPWGQQVDIKDYTLVMGPGSHHMFAFYQDSATDGANMACAAGGLTFAPFTFSAQSAHAEVTYPPTIGATLPATTGFMLNVHYINTGSMDLPGTVSLTMSIAKPGVVTNHAGVLFLNQAEMTVDPSCTTASGGCPSTSIYQLPQDVNILGAVSHMHRFGTHFVANTSTGVTLYETNEWAEPPWKMYCPPLHLASGTSIAWQCTDVNDTGSTLTFGEFANSNVMCISSNIFYPVSDVTNPVLGSQL